MSTRRISNWPAALALFLEEKQMQPFDWETNNCAFFACDWLAIVVRIDPAAQYRARVTSALSATRILEEAGGIEAIADEAAARHGWEKIDAKKAQRGDIVLCEADGGPALSVCVGENYVMTARGRPGLLFFPMNLALKAWRIA